MSKSRRTPAVGPVLERSLRAQLFDGEQVGITQISASVDPVGHAKRIGPMPPRTTRRLTVEILRRL